MSARPTRTGPSDSGGPDSGLVSQRSADAGIAAAANAALARNRLRCTSALHKTVETFTVSVHAVGMRSPWSAGRSLGLIPSSVTVTGRPAASVRTLAISSGTGALISSMTVNGCAQRGHPSWNLGRLDDTARRLIITGVVRTRELITHRVPFDRAADAYALIADAPQGTIKVVLTYDQHG